MERIGVPIRSTFDSKLTGQYARIISMLTTKGRSLIRDLEPTNDLSFMRIRCKKYEILISPGADYILLVVQDPNVNKSN
jgi:dynein light chain roadblock-type